MKLAILSLKQPNQRQIDAAKAACGRKTGRDRHRNCKPADQLVKAFYQLREGARDVRPGHAETRRRRSGAPRGNRRRSAWNRAGRGRRRPGQRDASLRDRRADRLPAASAGGRAAADGGAGFENPEILRPAQDPRGAARFRHLAVGRRAAAGGRGASGDEPLQPHPRDRLPEPLRRRPAGRHQSRHHHRGRGGGLLLRPRPVLADRLLDRRQRRGKFRRRALPEIRAYRQQRARHRDGADERRGSAPRRQASRRRGLRPHGHHDRLGRPARRRHRGDGAHPPEAGDGARAFDRLPNQRAGRPVRRRHHRRRHHPGRHGNDGPAGDPRGRGFRPCRLSARLRGAADRRTGRAGRRGRPLDSRGGKDRTS